jgi:glutamate-1-semialdehyde 2,1-aminomutase
VSRAASRALYRQALAALPGGVNSPVRSCRAVGCTPVFVRRGRGARIWDEDGNAYIDYVMSWGAQILGHAHPAVVAALRRCVAAGTGFGIPTGGETRLAERIKAAFPSIQRLRLVNSGTEAVMSAIRLSRGYTGRTKIVAFEGCYHGHSDSLLVRAGSGAAAHGIPVSAGVTPGVIADTLVLPYNDTAALEAALRRHGREIACVIVEPVAANMGVVPPRPGFLERMRELTARAGIVLIFDEVITGFRCGYGGAQQLYGIRPDLTCLGKIIGGGLPVGAYGGRREIMELVAPLGPVYQAGTLSGNPVSVCAGLTALTLLAAADYRALAERTQYLCGEVAAIARRKGVALTVNQTGSLFTLFFTDGPVTDYRGALAADRQRYARLFRALLRRGVYLPPAPFEAGFVSFSHGEREVEATVRAFAAAL